MKLLKKIEKCHPEAKDAIVFAFQPLDGVQFQIKNVGYSKKQKQPRILLED